MKVKLVFEKSFQEIRGLSSNTFSQDVDIEVPAGFNRAHLISARCYNPDQGSDEPVSDVAANIWDYQDEQRLVGKVLTYIDATYTDKEQREAHKNLTKDLLYGYFQDIHTRARQTIESQSK